MALRIINWQFKKYPHYILYTDKVVLCDENDYMTGWRMAKNTMSSEISRAAEQSYLKSR